MCSTLHVTIEEKGISKDFMDNRQDPVSTSRAGNILCAKRTSGGGLSPEVHGEVVIVGLPGVHGPMAAADDPLPDLGVQRAIKLLNVPPERQSVETREVVPMGQKGLCDAPPSARECHEERAPRGAFNPPGVEAWRDLVDINFGFPRCRLVSEVV